MDISTSSSSHPNTGLGPGPEVEPEPGEEEMCAVCHDSLDNGLANGVYTIHSCGHRFHTDCVLFWLSQDHRCPYCRGPSISESFHGALSGALEPWRGGRSNRRHRVRMISAFASKKGAPQDLARTKILLGQARRELTIAETKHKEFRRLNEAYFRENLKLSAKKERAKDKVIRLENRMLAFPMVLLPEALVRVGRTDTVDDSVR